VPEGRIGVFLFMELSLEGRRNAGPLRPEVLTRLTRELEVIEKRGLAPYFCCVWTSLRKPPARIPR